MSKYRAKFVKNVRGKLEALLNEQPAVKSEELGKFLASVASASATIGLVSAEEEALSLAGAMKEHQGRAWEKEELQNFLFPLISVLYFEELSDVEAKAEKGAGLGEEKLILLVDDDPALLMFLKDVLQENGWVAMAVADRDKAVQTYYDMHPDCVIINLKTAGSYEVLRKLKENISRQYVPIVVTSSDTAKATRVNSYRLGADDFILSPFDNDEFLVRINRQLERKQAMDEVALIDELTKVYNRKSLRRIYDYVRSNAKRKNEPFSMALIDLDHFKRINDTYGHVTGDAVLAGFADFLGESLRVGDIIIRYGGEEFLLLFPETSSREAKIVLERVLGDFSRKPFYSAEGQSAFFCTFSAGVQEVALEEADLKRNLEIADGALYDAKNGGRNQIKAVPSQSAAPRKKKIRIGIVDDDAIIRAMLGDLISKSKISGQFDLEVKSFNDGMEFYDSKWYLESRDPYLFILDGVMPKMDGIELLQKLRELPGQERFTIIMLTSRKSEQEIARAIQLGADDYITKPFKLLEMETRLNHLIKRMK